MFSATPERTQFGDFEETFKLIESVMGFLPNSTLYMSQDPALLMSFMMLSKAVLKQEVKISFMDKISNSFKFLKTMMQSDRQKDSLPMKYKWLIAYASSHAAGCFYCQQHTSHSAKQIGISDEQISEIFTFQNSQLFTEKEKAVIALGIAAGSVPNATSKQHFVELANYFTEKEILGLVAVTALFGFLNRWNSTLNPPLEDIFTAHNSPTHAP